MATRTWLDHLGGLFEAPADARTCYDISGGPQVHYLLAPEDERRLVPQTLCGQRAGAIPGDRDADCPNCLSVQRNQPVPRRPGEHGTAPAARHATAVQGLSQLNVPAAQVVLIANDKVLHESD